MKISKISLIMAIVLVFSVFTTACTSTSKDSVATVNGEGISKTVFNFYLTQVKSQIEQQQNTQGATDFWDTAEIEGKLAIDAAKEKALDEAVKATIISQKAKENKIKFSLNDEKMVEKQKSSTVSQIGGTEKYKAELKKQGLTDQAYTKLLENGLYAQKLQEKFAADVDDAAAKKYYDDNIARVKHVLVMTVDAQNQALPKEKQDEAKKKAEDILSKAKAGQDFDKLVETLSEDPGSKSQPDGYYLGKGFVLGQKGGMVQEFEKASLALAVGGISEIVETNYGYHIIKRYPNDPTMFDANKEEIVGRAKYSKFEDLQKEWKDAAKIVINEEVLASIK